MVYEEKFISKYNVPALQGKTFYNLFVDCNFLKLFLKNEIDYLAFVTIYIHFARFKIVLTQNICKINVKTKYIDNCFQLSDGRALSVSLLCPPFSFLCTSSRSRRGSATTPDTSWKTHMMDW